MPMIESSPSRAIVAPLSPAIDRSRSDVNDTKGWNAPMWLPAESAVDSTSAPSRPLVWSIVCPPYSRSGSMTN